MQLHNSSSLLSAQAERVVRPSELAVGDLVGATRGFYLILQVESVPSEFFPEVLVWEVQWCYIPHDRHRRTSLSSIRLNERDILTLFAKADP